MCEESHPNPTNLARQRTRLYMALRARDQLTPCLEKFGALDSNFERVDYAIKLTKDLNLHAVFQDDNKNDETAVKLREKGNEMFKVKKVKEAWEFYTRSISCAEENSANLGIAYANRSAVLFEVNLHKECLMDISRALENNYPEHLKTKLFVREKNLRNLDIEASKNPHESVPTVTSKNTKIDCASDCIEIREEKDWGRFIVASRDIKAGEVLAVEQPFASLLVSHDLNHCHECISLCYNLVPCKSCTHALYCSESCKERAFESYHKYECPILASLKYLELDKLKLLPLKIAFSIREQYPEIELLENEVSDVYQSNSYKEIHNLIANTSKRSSSDLFDRAVAAALIFGLVKDHTNFFDGRNKNFERVFKEILLLHMQTGPSNFHEITELAPNSTGVYEPEEIASGAFAFLSLLNHSCSPNVTRFCHGSTIVLRAIQDINKGEQCFDNYGYHHALMKRTDRQKQLQSQYYFDCACPACENDWGLYDVLPNGDPVEVDEKLISQLSSGEVDAAESVLRDFVGKLGDLQKLQPCKSFCQLQEILKQCFAVLGNKRRIF